MNIRTLTAGIVCAATLFVTSAGAAHASRPGPEEHVTTPTVSNRNLAGVVAGLLAEERRAVSTAERRLIHLDLVQTVRDQQ